MSNVKNSDDINIIKNKILKLYNDKALIHVTVNVKRKNIKNKPSEIISVYNNFFYVRSQNGFYNEEFFISYIDLLIGNISIKELN